MRTFSKLIAVKRGNSRQSELKVERLNQLPLIPVFLGIALQGMSSAWAEPSEGLIHILRNEMLPLTHEVNACSIKPSSGSRSSSSSFDSSIETVPSENVPLKESWVYHDFFITLRSRGSFVIPAFISIQIIPEITLGWRKTQLESAPVDLPMDEVSEAEF